MKRKGGIFRTGFVLAAVALGGMFADSLVKLSQAAFNDTFPCGASWTGNTTAQSFCEYQCLGGVKTQVRCGGCTITTGGGNCGNVSGVTCRRADGTIIWEAACSNLGGGFNLNTTSGSAPTGFSAAGGAHDSSGDCNCGTGCTGNCTYAYSYNMSAMNYVGTLTSSTCSSGCQCPGAPNYNGISPQTVSCVAGPPPTDPCAAHGGNADGDACCADVDCDDGDPSKCAPEQCHPNPVVCSGNCTYTSVQQGEPGNYVWQLSDATCTSGAPNCGCPTGPGGNCPLSGGLHTSVACGATGGPCTPTACSGECHYRAFSLGNGKFGWEHDTGIPDTCTAGASNCNCPSGPGGDCPINADAKKTIACGSASVDCTQPKCADHGGDADKDGCCKDKDIDDDDASVCESSCKGSYTLCQKCKKVDPQNPAGPLIACDPEAGTPEEKAACRCSACTSSGSQNDDCRCRNATNGDKDKDGCCDSVDKWPTDPTKGCECCDFDEAWDSAGGGEVKAQWARIWGASDLAASSPAAFGFMKYQQGSSQSSFITYNTSTQGWNVSGPAGEPDPITFTMSWSTWLGVSIPTFSIYIPVTVSQMQAVVSGSSVSGLGAAGAMSFWALLDSWHQWLRVALIWVMGVHLIATLFQEFRV